MLKRHNGQGVIEYVGGLVVATVLVALLLTVSTPMNGLISALNSYISKL